MTRTARQGLGAAGEGIARRHLEQLGYAFETGNWRCSSGELDLVMRDGEILVFVEVKTRRGERLGAAEESVTAMQAKRLLLTAQRFLADRSDLTDRFWRIDLVAVTLASSGTVARISHVVDAVHTA